MMQTGAQAPRLTVSLCRAARAGAQKSTARRVRQHGRRPVGMMLSAVLPIAVLPDVMTSVMTRRTTLRRTVIRNLATRSPVSQKTVTPNTVMEMKACTGHPISGQLRTADRSRVFPAVAVTVPLRAESLVRDACRPNPRSMPSFSQRSTLQES
jgi:hypothetical protein